MRSDRRNLSDFEAHLMISQPVINIETTTVMPYFCGELDNRPQTVQPFVLQSLPCLHKVSPGIDRSKDLVLPTSSVRGGEYGPVDG